MRPRRSTALAFVLATLCAVHPTAAQEVTFSGQVRPRFEFRNPVDGGADDFTSMRTRLTVSARLESGLTVLVQGQDVRIFGEESHPLFDFAADGLDLHQGYLRYRGESSSWLTTTIGRMEVLLGGQRLVGPVGWAQQGQSFDGLRFDVETERTRWAFLGFTTSDGTGAGATEEEELFGVYGTVTEIGPGALDLYWLYDRTSGAEGSDEHLLGARYAFSGRTSGRVEATLDRGSRGASDVAAFMIGARLGRTFSEGRATATLWYDYLSGDDPATPEVEVFNTLYATNHKFYGLADLFLNIPAHTGGAGLQDLAAKLTWLPVDQTTVGLDLHSFRAAQGADLMQTRFAEEVDLTVQRAIATGLTGTLGLSYVFQADGLEEIGRLDENMSWFSLMLNATF